MNGSKSFFLGKGDTLKRKTDGEMVRVVRQREIRAWTVETKRKKNTGEKPKF